MSATSTVGKTQHNEFLKNLIWVNDIYSVYNYKWSTKTFLVISDSELVHMIMILKLVESLMSQNIRLVCHRMSANNMRPHISWPVLCCKFAILIIHTQHIYLSLLVHYSLLSDFLKDILLFSYFLCCLANFFHKRGAAELH